MEVLASSQNRTLQYKLPSYAPFQAVFNRTQNTAHANSSVIFFLYFSALYILLSDTDVVESIATLFL